MTLWCRTIAWIGLTVAATYVVAEWSVLQKSGLHGLREAGAAIVKTVPFDYDGHWEAGMKAPVKVLDEPIEPERAALQAQVDQLAQTFAQYKTVKEREIADLMKLVANLEKQIRVLTAQRTPVEQVAAVPAASRPVRWATDGKGIMPPCPHNGDPPRVEHRWETAYLSRPVDLSTLAKEVGFTKVEVRR